MTFQVSFMIRTCPKDYHQHELNESFEVEVEASTFTQAQEIVFAAIKTAPSFTAYMDSLIVLQQPLTKKGND